MAAFRYWRVSSLGSWGDPTIKLSEFHLMADGVRVDGSASLSSSVPPVSGSLAALQDGDLDTDCELVNGTVLVWDFGSGNTAAVNNIKVGSTDARWSFLRFAMLEGSDDEGTWYPIEQFFGLKWPGARSLTGDAPRRPFDPYAPQVAYATGFDGSTITDISGNGVGFSVNGGTGQSTAQVKFGDKSLVIGTNAVSASFRTPAVIPITTGASVILEAWGYLTTHGGATPHLMQLGTSSSNRMNVYVDTSGYLVASFVASFSGSASWTMTSSVLFPTNEWVHVALVVDGTSKRLYQNNALVASTTSSAYLSSSNPYFVTAGNQFWGPSVANRWNGYVDEIRLSIGVRPVAYLGGRSSFVTSNLAALDPVPAYIPPPTFVSAGGYAMGFTETRYHPPLYPRPNFNFDPAARGRIVGTVKRKDDPDNVPLSRRVRLYRDRDGMLISETWSDAAGNYEFNYIEEGEAYTALALDHQHFYRAVAADNLTLANGNITLLDD